jgi:16S rRNA (cytosine967-C5)-methyltransferase
MSLYQHYLHTAATLIDKYDNKLPFHLYLKQYFSLHKKYGSRDRKLISAFCFNFLRLGHAFTDIPTQQRMLVAYFLISNQPGPLLASLHPRFNENIHLSLSEKLEIAGLHFNVADIFPYYHLLSTGMNGDAYCLSMLRQPDLFLRIRPGFIRKIEEKLNELGWEYSIENTNSLRLANSRPIEKYFHVNRELVIQDLNSQEVGIVIKKVFTNHHFSPSVVWDCCAASGGKSLMLYDLFPGIQLTVSDIRQTILENLETRFRQAGIKAKRKFVADLSVANNGKSYGTFPFILADVPCSGSGTWARTPEQLYYFEEAIIEKYSQRQKAIVKQLVCSLQAGGWLVYITCSVFKKENEEVVDFLINNSGLELVFQTLLDGTQKAADSMFISVLRKLFV